VGEVLWLGLLLGVGSGLSVGPIFLTILSDAARGGIGPAVRVILGSAAADIALIFPALAASWLLSAVAAASLWVAVVGAAVFVYLAVDAARQSARLLRRQEAPPPQERWGFWKGVLGNLGNPLSWTFWLATGTPTMLQADRAAGPAGVAAFTATWFLSAMAIEAGVAAVAARAGRMLGPRGLAAVSGVSAALFLGIAARLLLSGLHPG
jgi:threonine/homoserine/homoserine lactone efflux protein